jgi:hypothetical protein
LIRRLAVFFVGLAPLYGVLKEVFFCKYGLSRTMFGRITTAVLIEAFDGRTPISGDVVMGHSLQKGWLKALVQKQIGRDLELVLEMAVPGVFHVFAIPTKPAVRFASLVLVFCENLLNITIGWISLVKVISDLSVGVFQGGVGGSNKGRDCGCPLLGEFWVDVQHDSSIDIDVGVKGAVMKPEFQKEFRAIRIKIGLKPGVDDGKGGKDEGP